MMDIRDEGEMLARRAVRLQFLNHAFCLGAFALCCAASWLACALAWSPDEYVAWTVFFGALGLDGFAFAWTFACRWKKAEDRLDALWEARCRALFGHELDDGVGMAAHRIIWGTTGSGMTVSLDTLRAGMPS
jgi:apolipoprotein N-acyltransferase